VKRDFENGDCIAIVSFLETPTEEGIEEYLREN